ncbi:hypothetical protein EIG75_23565 [Pseudomonas syringae]|uniref:Uncharacterized protein n=1 Tax=Pseudomonas syringae TaxID=317 RepID=A0A6B2B0G9_PSESX|nr:hypothetical protein [Pseudomonas syringae pv. dysoxyli]NAO33474.1 hypothetical protein [Pseudomonas syringae]NAO44211.1 hypothetical protein [Pseudomonas syringae]NAO48975.1 hypothetical protein [Pseudomonas syringae]NAO62727.1 hypothetical protein [Pseudomonas syringae]
MLQRNRFADPKNIQAYVTTRVSQDVTECIDLIAQFPKFILVPFVRSIIFVRSTGKMHLHRSRSPPVEYRCKTGESLVLRELRGD